MAENPSDRTIRLKAAIKALQGPMPLSILQSIVGNKRASLTALYYTKLEASSISELFANAAERMDELAANAAERIDEDKSK